MNYDDNERIVNLYVPDGDINAILIALHPIYSSGLAMEVMTGLDEIGDKNGWVIAYANSLYSYWDDGRAEAGMPPPFGSVDDVGFIDNLAQSLSQKYGVDSTFLVGMGNGGSLATRIACETPEQFDGIVAVSVLSFDYVIDNCNAQDSQSATNLLFIYGDHDFIYLEDGRTLQSATDSQTWDINSAADTLNYWSDHNHCDSASETSVGTTTIYANCANNTVTAFYTIPGGAGNWPRMANNDLNRLGIDASAIVSAFLSGDEHWVDLTNQDVSSDNIARAYTLYVPQSYDPNTPTPVVLSLHGRYASMVNQARSSGFNDVADEHGFIVVYPQAYDPRLEDPTWNYLLGTSLLSDQPWNDDLFLDTLVDDLAKDLNIDMSRLYVSGLSNGAYMTNRLACTRSDRYAAFAPVAGAAPFGLNELCKDTGHSPYMLVQGTADNISPWKGIVSVHPFTGKQIYAIAPVENTLSFWADQNGCQGDVVRQDLPGNDPNSYVSMLTLDGCPADGPVILYAVVGGGHVWPGVFDFDSELLGEVNMDYNASEVIWDFFSHYNLDGKIEQ